MTEDKEKTNTTRILFDGNSDRFYCEKCGKVFDWNFNFKRCPYCNRIVTESQKRW